jgi:hypothetical protein
MNCFQLRGLDPQRFAALFELSDRELLAKGMVRRYSDTETGFPCRVGLSDAAPGSELILLNYLHHDVSSPYRASGPIYVSRHFQRGKLPPGEVNAYVTRRLLSVRAYDESHMLINAEVIVGDQVKSFLADCFERSSVAYAHLHSARPGCFLAEARRV